MLVVAVDSVAGKRWTFRRLGRAEVPVFVRPPGRVLPEWCVPFFGRTWLRRCVPFFGRTWLWGGVPFFGRTCLFLQSVSIYLLALPLTFSLPRKSLDWAVWMHLLSPSCLDAELETFRKALSVSKPLSLIFRIKFFAAALYLDVFLRRLCRLWCYRPVWLLVTVRLLSWWSAQLLWGLAWACWSFFDDFGGAWTCRCFHSKFLITGISTN